MFPNHSKVSRMASGRIWLMSAVALALMLAAGAIFGFSTAQAATPSGDFCIDGLVIDHEENPLVGWQVTITESSGVTQTATSAAEPTDAQRKQVDKDKLLRKGEFKFDPLIPGIYTATIGLPDGWIGVTPTSIRVPLTEGKDGCVRIRFKVEQIKTVIVHKIDANHNPLSGWTIEAQPGPGNFFAIPQRVDTSITGTAVFTLTPGIWVFSERQPKPSDVPDGESNQPDPYSPVLPPTGRQTLDVKPDGGPYTVVFKNEFMNNGCIVVQKYALADTSAITNGYGITVTGLITPVYGAGGWGFKLLRKDGSLVRQGVTEADGSLKFDRLPYGPYVLQEEDRPGWNELVPRKQDINVTSGQCVPVTFENQQDNSGFCIKGRKIDANGGYGIAGWKITTDPLSKDGYEPADVFTDGLGEFQINLPKNDYRIPGGKFKVCEENKDGWVPQSPSCQTVVLPKWPGACVQIPDFVNQQVGHSADGKYGKNGMDPKGGNNVMGPDPKGNNGQGNKGQDGYGQGNMGQDGYGQGSMGQDGKGQSCQAYHKVKKGEGLFDIGEQYHVSAQAMLDANPSVARQPNFWVYVGQSICIP